MIITIKMYFYIMQVFGLLILTHTQTNVVKCSTNQTNGIANNSNCEQISDSDMCPNGCASNEQCIAPDRCECRRGYIRLSYNHKCQAFCEQDCAANFTCVAPNKCERICSNACPEHASCTDDDTCMCEQGYQMIEQTCQPICTPSCEAGQLCTAPNRCARDEANCMNELNLLGFRVLISCDQNPTVIYAIFYGILIVAILLCCFIAWKCWKRFRRSFHTRYNPAEDYSINFRHDIVRDGSSYK